MLFAAVSFLFSLVLFTALRPYHYQPDEGYLMAVAGVCVLSYLLGIYNQERFSRLRMTVGGAAASVIRDHARVLDGLQVANQMLRQAQAVGLEIRRLNTGSWVLGGHLFAVFAWLLAYGLVQ